MKKNSIDEFAMTFQNFVTSIKNVRIVTYTKITSDIINIYRDNI